MPKTQSERRRLKGLTVNLFSSNTLLGWSVVCQVSAVEAMEKIAGQKWRAIWYDNGTLAGVQMLKEAPVSSGKTVPVLQGSSPTITLIELQRNAGLYGRSHTRGMPEWKRAKRHAKFDDKKILPPEDAIERAQEKVRLWPFPASRIDDGSGEPVFGDRAVRVYPKPSQR